MRFESSTIGSVLVVKVLEGRISADVASSFKEDLLSYATKGNRTIVLDMSEVTFLDSSGLGALIGCLKVMGDGGELVLCGARESVASMFKLTRMNKVFRTFDSLEKAVSAVS